MYNVHSDLIYLGDVKLTDVQVRHRATNTIVTIPSVVYVVQHKELQSLVAITNRGVVVIPSIFELCYGPDPLMEMTGLKEHLDLKYNQYWKPAWLEPETRQDKKVAPEQESIVQQLIERVTYLEKIVLSQQPVADKEPEQKKESETLSERLAKRRLVNNAKTNRYLRMLRLLEMIERRPTATRDIMVEVTGNTLTVVKAITSKMRTARVLSNEGTHYSPNWVIDWERFLEVYPPNELFSID